jgi:hypothetical protein
MIAPTAPPSTQSTSTLPNFDPIATTGGLAESAATIARSEPVASTIVLPKATIAAPAALRRAAAPDEGSERRARARTSVFADLWMIDHGGDTVLRCHALETSEVGMRLRVPVGYGVAEGQRYELTSHPPGEPRGVSLGFTKSRWVRVVRTKLRVHDGEDHLDVGVVFESEA